MCEEESGGVLIGDGLHLGFHHMLNEGGFATTYSKRGSFRLLLPRKRLFSALVSVTCNIR